MKTVSKALSFAVVLIFARGAPAQSTSAPIAKSDWDNLRMLTTGAEIRVMTTDHKTIRGTFQSVTDEALIVDQPSGGQMLARSSVMSVSLKAHGHRIRHLLIGLGVGAAGGVGVGVAARGSCQPGHTIGPCPTRGELGAVVGGAGAAIGAIIGAALPAGGWREIYRTP